MRTRIPPLVLALLGLAVALPAPAPAQPPPPVQPAKPAGLAVVPTDSFAFFTVNFAKMWDTPGFKPLRDWLAAQNPGPTDQAFGIPAADIDRLTAFSPGVSRRWVGEPVLIVTTKKPYNEARVLKALNVENADPGHGGPQRAGNAIRTDNAAFPFVVLVDDRTLLLLPERREDGLGTAALLGQLLARKADGPLAAALADAGKHDIAFAMDARPVAALFEIEENRKAAPYLALFKARTLGVAIDFDKTARGSLRLEFANADDAKRAAPVLREAFGELIGALGKELERGKDRMDHGQRAFLEAAIPILKAGKVHQDGANVFATAEAPYEDAVARLAATLPKEYKAAVSSAKGQNNLKQLALAMHNFESTYQVFPSDVAPGGKLAWSWRVQILPYIEQDNLWKQLDHDKAWDAPENLKALEAMTMPKVFEIPGRPAPKGHTYFRIFTRPKDAKGKARPWLVEGEPGARIATITDGLSNTFTIVEAGEAVPWYKPDVLAYDGELPLPQLGDKAADRFIAAMGDGSVKSLRPSKLDEKTLRALITPQGGEVVNLP